MQTIIEPDDQAPDSPVASIKAPYTTVGTPSSQRDNYPRTPESNKSIYGSDRDRVNPTAYSTNTSSASYSNGGSQNNSTASLPFNGGIIPFIDPSTLNISMEGKRSPRYSPGADSLRPYSDSQTSSNPRYSNGPAQYSDRSGQNARVAGQRETQNHDDEFMYNDIPVYANASSPEHRYNNAAYK